MANDGITVTPYSIPYVHFELAVREGCARVEILQSMLTPKGAADGAS